MSKLTPYCKTCGGIYNCSCLTPREDRLARAEAQVAALVEENGKTWARAVKSTLHDCAKMLEGAIPNEKAEPFMSAMAQHDKRVSAAAYARGVEDEKKRCIGIAEYSIDDPKTREKTVGRIREGHTQHTNSALLPGTARAGSGE